MNGPSNVTFTGGVALGGNRLHSKSHLNPISIKKETPGAKISFGVPRILILGPTILGRIQVSGLGYFGASPFRKRLI